MNSKTRALSRREKEILLGIAAGKQLKQISVELHMSINNVKNRAAQLRRYLSAINNANLIARAFELGYLTLEEVA